MGQMWSVTDYGYINQVRGVWTSSPSTTPVPEPATLIYLSFGLIGFMATRKLKRI
jgi:hypothetical protein